MNATYRHTQPGYYLVAVVASVLAVVATTTQLLPVPSVLGMFGLGVLALCLVLMPSLTTVVRDARVICYFGPGLIRRSIDVGDIAACHVVHYQLVHGIGLHSVGNGWLWNVSGNEAVELELKSGRVFRIGTDEPDALCEAIANERSRAYRVFGKSTGVSA